MSQTGCGTSQVMALELNTYQDVISEGVGGVVSGAFAKILDMISDKSIPFAAQLN